MRNERLLDRIRILEKNPGARFEVEPGSSERIRAVRQYLQRILNTRQGNARIAEEFGIPDLTDLPSSMGGEVISQMQQTFQRVIKRFEPRMAQVRVRIQRDEENAAKLRFQITGSLRMDDGTTPAVFEAEVEPGGRIMITG